VSERNINTLNAELNPICHLLALLGAHHIFHISRIWVKILSEKSNAKCPGFDKKVCTKTDFDVSLTVHFSIILANDQLVAQFFNIFITILFMFRAIACSSSRCQIVLIQHLVPSLSVSDCSVHRLRKNLLRMSTILFETCRGL
jgi:hypothetical protein